MNESWVVRLDGSDEKDVSGLQLVVTETVGDVLGLAQVKASDNFFEIGGDSLCATIVIARLRTELGVDISLRLLLESRDLLALAEKIHWEIANPGTSGIDEHIRVNRELWNTWAPISERSDYYDLEGFRAGRIDVRPYEIDELGDVRGKSLLHLMCHIGTDTLSWARLGASVTGIDLSDRAIEIAQRLAAETEIEARFIASDIDHLSEILTEEFDIVYTSRGVMWWVPDLERWGETVARCLVPGGTFYITEVHPILMTFDTLNVQPGDLKLTESYFSQDEPRRFEFKGSYADLRADTGVLSEVSWSHGLGETITALASAGLRIEFVHERPFMEWPIACLVEAGVGQYVLPDSISGELPLSYSLMATRP